jgi:hypothetical protein
MSDLQVPSNKFRYGQSLLLFTNEIDFFMNKPVTAPQLTRSEQETENEANRLTAQVDAALAAVAMRSPDSNESLESAADRIERVARDLATALRGLAQERKSAQTES